MNLPWREYGKIAAVPLTSSQPPNPHPNQKSRHRRVDESAPRIVLGYFTLATSAVPRDFFPTKHVRGLPRCDLPLILLARLAVDYRFAGKGLGPQLLAEAFRISVAVSEQIGCRCIITDAYRDKVSWYAKYGFIPLEGGSENQPTRRMFLDIRTLKATLKG